MELQGRRHRRVNAWALRGSFVLRAGGLSARRLVFGERELPGWCHFAGTSLRELPLLERPRADDSLLILASPFGETFAVGGHRTST